MAGQSEKTLFLGEVAAKVSIYNPTMLSHIALLITSPLMSTTETFVIETPYFNVLK